MSRIKRAWNAFTARDTNPIYEQFGPSTTRPPATMPMSINSRTITSAIYSRIAIDVSMLTYMHIKNNDEGVYVEDIDSGINRCMNLKANVDQSGTQLLNNIVLQMMEHGVAVVVPILKQYDPLSQRDIDIKDVRVGSVIEWFPEHVLVNVWNNQSMQDQQITVRKDEVAIIVNPLFNVMNQPNSLLKQLVSKLNYLSILEASTESTKLNIVLQMPNATNRESKRKIAEDRVKALEEQLAKSSYGIGYIDVNDKITQINRAAENSVLATVQYLTDMLYNQLGMPESIFNGTANELERIGYFNGTCEPIAKAITDSFTNAFISEKGIDDGERITYFRDVFKHSTVNQLADTASKLVNAEVISSNEVRPVIGKKPSSDPRADELINRNINTIELKEESNNEKEEI